LTGGDVAESSGQLAFEAALSGQRVFVTGHTGFTGGWLSLWLHSIGCTVTGLALAPNTEPNLFTGADISRCVRSEIGDIRSFGVVEKVMQEARPTIVFHLAAQPLVSQSFVHPIDTFATNVMGTAHVLEAARLSDSVKAIVCVTTDKVYADRDWHWGYRELDQLGGKDPYAASKACAELVAHCYSATMALRGNGVLVATARGGNIIGGGDWSEDRIVPDLVRAVVSSAPLVLRNPAAVRPWQHVLALVHGYLMLAGRLLDGQTKFADAWNFGPLDDHAVPVRVLVDRLGAAWKRPDVVHATGTFPEIRFLRVDSTKARELLGWRPSLDFEGAARLTAEWYRDYYARPLSAEALTTAQIHGYRRQLGSVQ
jgi:CDP-glucose 4,6-dehydratase